jgi:hypothetical protein
MLAEIFMVHLEATRRGSQDSAAANARFVPFDRTAFELERSRRALALKRWRGAVPDAGDSVTAPGRADDATA